METATISTCCGHVSEVDASAWMAADMSAQDATIC